MSKNVVKRVLQAYSSKTRTDVMASISDTPDLKSISLGLTRGTLVITFADT